MKYLIFTASLFFIPLAHADLIVSFINEARLPYELSSRNYDISSRNYDNSIRNYDNSPRNYDNSPRNYDNSPRNSDNGSSSNNRLLIEKGSSLYRIGYYTKNSSGITNFYSTSGERIFYNPKLGAGIYGGESGDFSGVLADVEEEYRLVLTESGQKTLFISQ